MQTIINQPSTNKVVDDDAPIDEVENQEEDICDQGYNEMDDINFPTSNLTEEEDQVYYYDN